MQLQTESQAAAEEEETTHIASRLLSHDPHPDPLDPLLPLQPVRSHKSGSKFKLHPSCVLQA